MTITNFIAVCTVFGLTIGNLAYQFMTGQNAWEVAVERSCFQAIAVACLMLICWLGSEW